MIDFGTAARLMENRTPVYYLFGGGGKRRHVNKGIITKLSAVKYPENSTIFHAEVNHGGVFSLDTLFENINELIPQKTNIVELSNKAHELMEWGTQSCPRCGILFNDKKGELDSSRVKRKISHDGWGLSEFWECLVCKAEWIVRFKVTGVNFVNYTEGEGSKWFNSPEK